VGARIVKLDERLGRADVAPQEWNELLSWVAPPAGSLSSSNRAARADVILPHAAQRPWAPAHLRAKRLASGDIEVSWVRCARIGGDAWGPGEPPLGAPTERYLLEILDGEALVRLAEVDAPSFDYSTADQIEDFGTLPSLLRIRAGQLGESGAPGLKTELTITL
jgi:hypothetical protein